jgi:hypothetical protein
MVLRIDHFGFQFEDSIPAFVEVDHKHVLHRVTSRFLDRDSLQAKWTEEGYIPSAEEWGTSSDWLWEHYKIGSPMGDGGGGGSFDGTDPASLPVGTSQVQLVAYEKRGTNDFWWLNIGTGGAKPYEWTTDKGGALGYTDSGLLQFPQIQSGTTQIGIKDANGVITTFSVADLGLLDGQFAPAEFVPPVTLSEEA